MSNELKSHSTDLQDLRLLKERLEYDNKESAIQIDTLNQQIEENERDIEDLRKQMETLKGEVKDAAVEEKERKKAEKMATMMAKFDAVRSMRLANKTELISNYLRGVLGTETLICTCPRLLPPFTRPSLVVLVNTGWCFWRGIRRSSHDPYQTRSVRSLGRVNSPRSQRPRNSPSPACRGPGHAERCHRAIEGRPRRGG